MHCRTFVDDRLHCTPITNTLNIAHCLHCKLQSVSSASTHLISHLAPFLLNTPQSWTMATIMIFDHHHHHHSESLMTIFFSQAKRSLHHLLHLPLTTSWWHHHTWYLSYFFPRAKILTKFFSTPNAHKNYRLSHIIWKFSTWQNVFSKDIVRCVRDKFHVWKSHHFKFIFGWDTDDDDRVNVPKYDEENCLKKKGQRSKKRLRLPCPLLILLIITTSTTPRLVTISVVLLYCSAVPSVQVKYNFPPVHLIQNLEPMPSLFFLSFCPNQ